MTDKNLLSYIMRSAVLGLTLVCFATYWAMGLRASAQAGEVENPASSINTLPPDGSAPAVAQLPKVSDLPAEHVYKNIKIFVGVPASRVPRAMDFISASLGVECTHCHVKDEWEKEDLPAKQNARRMFDMERVIHKEIGSNKVACYTCHRGKPRPGPQSFSPPDWKPPAENRWADQGDKKAEQVFKNVQVLKGEAAKNWMTVMSFMSASLGVDCTHCHVAGAFEKDDKPAKQTARKMLQMVTAVGLQFYEKGNRISCYTCHRGKVEPEKMPK